LEEAGRYLGTTVGEWILIGVDLHNTLDDGTESGNIPSDSIQALELLLNNGFLPWIPSYIGFEGEHSKAHRALAEEKRQQIARELGLRPKAVSCPTPDYLCLCIIDSRTWSERPNPRWNFNGKAAALQHHHTRILIDDNLGIVEECLDAGILAYKVAPNKRRKREPACTFQPFVREGIPHTSNSTLLETVCDLINERDSGDLWVKLGLCELHRKW